MRTTDAILTLGLAFFTGGTASAQRGTEPGEWHYYGGDLGSTRYAPLDQINRDNVGALEIAWQFETRNLGPRPDTNWRATPIMVDGVLYTTAGSRRSAIAIDAGTGELLWFYRFDEGERGLTAPRQTSGRGVSYWTDGEEKRVFFITPAYYLVALDAGTGRPFPDFGRDGIVDLKEGLDRPVDLVKDAIGSSTPPIVVGDVVIMGAALPSGGAPPTKEMPPGHVRGYDVRTGKRLWIFHTIPEPGEVGHETWENDSWRTTGNVAVWTSLSADPDLGYVYLPTEAPTGDYYGGHRHGSNLFSDSLVCLDARTGARVWHFQTVYHDIWDYDLPAAPVLADIRVDGREIPAIAQVTKQGFTFVLDRRTGEPVWPIEERPVPQTDVPGEKTWPTQPFPTKPAPFDRQGVSEDDLIDLTPELKEEALKIASFYRLGPLFTPPSLVTETKKGTLTLPGSQGGANWPGAALDPDTGILYVASSTYPTALGLIADPEHSNMDYVRGPRLMLPEGGGPRGLPLIKPPWGRITAIDLNSGEHVWMIPNGEAPDYVREHPALEGVELPRTGRPERAGLLVTKTLLFAGEGGGLFGMYGGGGNKLRAHDKATGEILAEIELPANQTGVPMTYLHEGVQYIVVAVGASDHPAELVALRLPREKAE
ncbi:MAG TPA: pyrroloquinoline quinone-dependent dehydrogenase [Vicinamibacteria bacterium]|nr:pyrroloquinoline quinone-dependent dehydrogenase [Vicinamibacteria bacterium]